jgi:hypothetical protein
VRFHFVSDAYILHFRQYNGWYSFLSVIFWRFGKVTPSYNVPMVNSNSDYEMLLSRNVNIRKSEHYPYLHVYILCCLSYNPSQTSLHFGHGHSQLGRVVRSKQLKQSCIRTCTWLLCVRTQFAHVEVLVLSLPSETIGVEWRYWMLSSGMLFWVVTPCSLVGEYRKKVLPSFKGAFLPWRLKTSVTVYQSTRSHDTDTHDHQGRSRRWKKQIPKKRQ